MTRALQALILIFILININESPAAPKESLRSTAKPGDAAEIKVEKGGAAKEDMDRRVDQAAQASQEQAIAKLSNLLRKYIGTRQEPILLSKLGELQLQNSAILFRISHGIAHRSKKTIDLTKYKKAMQSSISTLTTLIRKYPNYEEIFLAYFNRGKAFEEIQDKNSATRDYLHLVKVFPDVEETAPAYMSLAEFAIEKNEHAKAISYLKEVEKRPDSPHFPFALFKLGWSNYNLKNIPVALNYLERHVAFYKSLKDLTGDASVTSDIALRENSLLDVTLFYMEGYEQGLTQYSLKEALTYFRKLDSGPILGRMILRFSKLLRSHSREADIIAWSKEVLETESDRPESLDALLIAYEFQLNKRRYDHLTQSSKEIVKLYAKHKGYESFPKAQKLLLDTADGLQAILIKNKGASNVQTLSPTLATIYDSFTKIVEDTDPRIPRVHYNLAETLFTIKDFNGATEHYRWVVERGNSAKKDKTIADAALKAISSRYEVLRLKNLIPKELAAKPISKDSDSKLEPLLGEWIEWIDTHLSKNSSTGVEAQKQTENFVFEANRALYGQSHIKDALIRMKKFSTKYSKSTYAVPSASLAVDTYVASSDWEGTHEIAVELMEVQEWKTSKFGEHLFKVAADAFYKQVEALHRAHDYKATLKLADQFLKRYSKSARLGDCLSIAGGAALTLADRDRAMAYFSRLIKDVPKSQNVGSALLAKASIEEDRFEFLNAANDYKGYLSLVGAVSGFKIEEGQADGLRKKTLVLTWLSGDRPALSSILASKAICTESLTQECDKYGALLALADPGKASDEAFVEKAYALSRKSDSKELKTIWSAVALEGSKHLEFRDRLNAIRQLSEGWADSDPLVKFVLLPHMNRVIPKTFQLNRKSLNQVAPLRANEKHITHRIDWIRLIENAGTRAMKLPWSRIRAETLNEMAGLYLDLASDLNKLSPPKGLNPEEFASYQETIRKIVLPFEEKGQEMRGKAFEIAALFSIEDDSFAAISEPFFVENPSQAKVLRPTSKIDNPIALDFALLDELDPNGKWDDVADGDYKDSNDPALRIKSEWAHSLGTKNWQQVAFFMQEAQEKALIQAGAMNLVKALSFAAAGARGEALAEIDEARKDLEPSSKTVATITLLQHSLRSCSRERTKVLLSDLPPTGLSKKFATWAAIASVYTGTGARQPAETPAKTKK